MTESEFRGLAKQVYDHIERQFEDIDPDVAECEVAQGALTITLENGARWVLSQQPPARQLWLAVASLGRAYHFDYRPDDGRWWDDKGEGVELLSTLQSLLQEHAGLDIRL